jgi:hypothetical protein
MYRIVRLAIALAVLVLNPVSSTAAGSQEAFKDAYAKAEAAKDRAAKLKNQWTTTQSVLVAAKKAADGGDYEAAVQLSKLAEDLANASIAQSEREDKLWKDAEIH